METIYRNYKAAVDYYANKAEEASRELKHLDQSLREAFLQHSATFHVIKDEKTSSEETENSTDSNDREEKSKLPSEDTIDESNLGAVGGAPLSRSTI